MTRDFYEKAYAILVELGGAPPSMREAFVSYFTAPEHSDPFGNPLEWRFMGHLGGGGKFWRTHRGHDVNCYEESRTPERDQLISTINAKLRDLEAFSQVTLRP